MSVENLPVKFPQMKNQDVIVNRATTHSCKGLSFMAFSARIITVIFSSILNAIFGFESIAVRLLAFIFKIVELQPRIIKFFIFLINLN